MSSPPSINYRLSPFLAKRAVPEGSHDFQKVLDAFLINDDSEKRPTSCTCQDQDLEDLEDYEDNFERPTWANNYPVTTSFRNDDAHFNSDDTDDDNDNNNRIYGKDFKYVCPLPQCRRYNREVQSLTNPRNPVSVWSSDEIVFDCNGSLNCVSGDHTIYNYSEVDSPRDPSFKLPNINTSGSMMGTTCSSNVYDKREWHNVAGNDKFDERSRKRGKQPGNRPQSLIDDSTIMGDKVGESKNSNTTCICAHSNSENNLKTPTFNDVDGCLSNSLNSRSPSPQNDPSAQNNKDSGKDKSKKASGSPGSSTHSKLSRVSSSKKSNSSSSKLDVSPHRLLTRRSYSPQSRVNAVDGMRHSWMSNDYYRQRSRSWSGSKLGEMMSPKSPSPPTLRIHSPEPLSNGDNKQMTNNSPVISKSSSYSTSNSSSSNSTSSLPAINPQNKNHARSPDSSAKSHEQWCPMFKEIEKEKLSVDYLECDLTPISRRRAVSESHTSRRIRTPRKTHSGESEHCEDHPHVRWADEERGSSLSTSVFLSSIRPRSFSHGAMANTPQRPILKKVTGF